MILMWTHALHGVTPRKPTSPTRWTVVYGYRNPGRPSKARWISEEFDLRRPTNEKERAHRTTSLAFIAMLRGIRRGDRVVFSGVLNTGLGTWCYGPANWLIQNRHDEPEYFMRFSKIARF